MKRRTAIYRWTQEMSFLCMRGKGAIAKAMNKAARNSAPSARQPEPFIANKKGMRWRANSKTGVAECVSRHAR